MVKKLVLGLVLAGFTAGVVFAQDASAQPAPAQPAAKKLFSIGGGLMLVPSFESKKPKGIDKTNDASGFGVGPNVFFDATYVEANFGLVFNNQKASKDDDTGVDTTNLLIGIVGKIPLNLSEKMTFFPFAGIDYLINFSASANGHESSDYGDHINALSIVCGLGIDYSISQALYVRGELGFGYTFASKTENDAKDSYDSLFKGKVPIKVAIGYRL